MSKHTPWMVRDTQLPPPGNDCNFRRPAKTIGQEIKSALNVCEIPGCIKRKEASNKYYCRYHTMRIVGDSWE